VLPLLVLGLLALSPARADAAPLTGATNLDGLTGTTCVATGTGEARCWGEGSNGQLGNGNNADAGVAVPVSDIDQVGPLTGVKQVTAGTNHACAVLQTGRAVCWGDDGNGQLGNGAGDQDSATPRFVRNAADTGPLSGVAQISAGASFTCARMTSGQARCWGTDQSGQLGDAGPFAFEEQLPRTVAASTGGGVLTGITQLTTGAFHACVRLNSGQARCWGQNSEGQLGNGGFANSNGPTVVKNIPGVSFLPKVTQVSAGGNTTCARLANSQARCWGAGEDGQLGNAEAVDHPRPVVVRAPSGTGGLVNVTQIAVGADHTCFRISNGQARCTGEGVQGQLGNPNFGDQVTRPVVVRNGTDTGPLVGVAQVSVGTQFGCARLTSGQARCWGTDTFHGLGNGPDGSSDVPVAVLIP
jgi:alpha-tubulin suppressor-like RCC1 family protein